MRKSEIEDLLKNINYKNVEFVDEKIKNKNIFSQEEALIDAKDLREKIKIHPGLYYQENFEKIELECENMITKIESKKEWERKELFKIYSKFIQNLFLN